jgi:hypothetical protein
MSFLAANPAGFSYLSPSLVERANAAYQPATTMANYVLPTADMPARIGLRLRRVFIAKAPMRTLLWRVSAVMYPVFYSVTASGSFRRPSALGPLLRVLTQQANTELAGDPDLRAPSGSRFLPKQVCNRRHKTPRKLLSGPSQKADLRPWEPDPLARLRPV